jgi:hypothetical protein
MSEQTKQAERLLKHLDDSAKTYLKLRKRLGRLSLDSEEYEDVEGKLYAYVFQVQLDASDAHNAIDKLLADPMAVNG